MRSFRTAFSLFAAFLVTYATAAQSTANSATAIPRDPQAILVLNQAIAAAGGTASVFSVRDYTATGSITLPLAQSLEGSVTITALGLSERRMDIALATGTRSWAVHQGIASAKAEDGTVTSLDPKTRGKNWKQMPPPPYRTPLFAGAVLLPSKQLQAILADPQYGLSYKGSTEADGHTVYEISAQLYTPELSATSADPTSHLPHAVPFHSKDFFIDASTSQVVMTQEIGTSNFLEQYHYSQYQQVVAGLSIPFVVSEVDAGHTIWTVQLTQINFNSGLQSAAFALK